MRGFALSVPRAEPPTGELDELVFVKQGVRVIEGTTDFYMYMDEEHKRLIDGAVRATRSGTTYFCARNRCCERGAVQSPPNPLLETGLTRNSPHCERHFRRGREQQK